jgi:hypothetical protein
VGVHWWLRFVDLAWDLVPSLATRHPRPSPGWLRFVDFASVGGRGWLRFLASALAGGRSWLRFLAFAGPGGRGWLRFVDFALAFVPRPSTHHLPPSCGWLRFVVFVSDDRRVLRCPGPVRFASHHLPSSPLRAPRTPSGRPDILIIIETFAGLAPRLRKFLRRDRPPGRTIGSKREEAVDQLPQDALGALPTRWTRSEHRPL